MDSKTKHCIINGHDNRGWYQQGAKRLERSLVYHGFNGDFISLDYSEHKDYDETCPYTLKAIALERAINKGYKRIMWLDCSVWAINDPNPIFDVITHEGWYFWKSGYNCAQSCSDKCLEYFKASRDEAEKMIECSTSMFGLNMDNPKSIEFAKRFIQSSKDGAFHGSRLHDNQSEDKRFLFHRQDQSAASIILNQLEMTIHEPNIYSCYYDAKNMNESIIFTMRGM